MELTWCGKKLRDLSERELRLAVKSIPHQSLAGEAAILAELQRREQEGEATWARKVATDWFSIAPQHRTKERLTQHLLIWMSKTGEKT